MKGGRKDSAGRPLVGEVGGLSADYYLLYLQALERLFHKQVAK